MAYCRFKSMMPVSFAHPQESALEDGRVPGAGWQPSAEIRGEGEGRGRGLARGDRRR